MALVDLEVTVTVHSIALPRARRRHAPKQIEPKDAPTELNALLP